MPAQVLVVHDDALTCELIREILCLAGMQAVSLTDSAEVDRAQAVLESLNISWHLEGEKSSRTCAPERRLGEQFDPRVSI